MLYFQSCFASNNLFLFLFALFYALASTCYLYKGVIGQVDYLLIFWSIVQELCWGKSPISIFAPKDVICWIVKMHDLRLKTDGISFNETRNLHFDPGNIIIFANIFCIPHVLYHVLRDSAREAEWESVDELIELGACSWIGD